MTTNGASIACHTDYYLYLCAYKYGWSDILLIIRIYRYSSKTNITMENYEWAKEMNCAVTVCDAEGVIIYMNDKSRETYKKEGDLIGKNLFACHSERSREIIRHLLETGGSNSYTIEKQGLHKVIYQTAWKKDGKVAGIVEISMVTPADMPHYVRG
mgnify:CR=1 FL=1